jgi:hypothetical protein
MDEKIKKQIEAIRQTGKTNMFDTIAVQRIAFDKKFFELVIFIEDEREKYVDLILHGDKSNI